MNRQEIAILGGGIAGLSAALELTSTPDWKERFNITVYQRGWRLGGKGASSRNPDCFDRNEEHGLHVWFGCYHESFRLLRGCYGQLNRSSTHPFPSIEDAFKPQNHTPVGEFVDGEWRLWPVSFPTTPGDPGTSTRATVWDNIKALLAFADQAFAEWSTTADIGEARARIRWWQGKSSVAEAQADSLSQCNKLTQEHRANPDRQYHRGPAAVGDAYSTWRYRRGILSRLRGFRKLSKFHASPRTESDDVRRKRIMIDLAITIAIGFFTDGVLFCGIHCINDEDLRHWLTRHGAREETVWSGLIRALYDLCFAYENGETGDGSPENPGRPDFAAGAALEVAMRIVLTYSKSVCFELQSGMGEIVFAPIYLVLKQRGVHFEFFHDVKRLELTPDGKSIARIRIGRQVRLKTGNYDPLITVKGCECWRHEPDADQIVDGESLRGKNLESRWSGWKDVEEVVLHARNNSDDSNPVEKRFDRAILAIPVGALGEVCEELVKRKPAWRRMMKHVKTVQTIGVQMWVNKDLIGTGWKHGRVPVNAAPEPLDVWMDSSEMLERESWPSDGPRSSHYLCGPLPGNYASAPRTDLKTPDRALRQAEDVTRSWLNAYGSQIWPTLGGKDSGFAWDALYDPKGRVGDERLKYQYIRPNVDPSERYVISVKGSTRHRLHPSNSGCGNLLLAGDWTQTPHNAGCIEAAVISGMTAAHSIMHVSEKVNFWLLLWRIVGAVPCLFFAILRAARRGIARVFHGKPARRHHHSSKTAKPSDS